MIYGVLGAFFLVVVPLKGQAWNLLFAVYCVAVVIYLLAALSHNMRRYPEALRRWESSFMYQRCDAIIQSQISAASQGRELSANTSWLLLGMGSTPHLACCKGRNDHMALISTGVVI